MANATVIVDDVAAVVLPRDVVVRLARFLEGGPSGQIVLDVTNGQITGVRLTESIRLDRRKQ